MGKGKVTRPLTDRQLDLLLAMKRGVEITFCPYLGRLNPREYYRRSDTGRRCSAEAKALTDRNLARHISGHFSGLLVLTQEGRAHSGRNTEA